MKLELHRLLDEGSALFLAETYRYLGYVTRILLDPFDETHPWVMEVRS